MRNWKGKIDGVEIDEFEFESVAELAEYARTRTPKGTRETTRDKGLTAPGHGGYNFKSFEEAHKGALEGWEEGRDRVNDALKNIISATGTLVHPNRKVWDVEGEILDEDRYMRGEPDCMIDLRPDPHHYVKGARKTRTLDLVVNLGASWAVEAAIKNARGATVLALVDALEANGFRCRLRAISTVRDTNRWKPSRCLRVMTHLKEPDQRIDMDALAYALVSSDILRRHNWSVLEGMSWFPEVEHGYGYSVLRKQSREYLMPETDIDMPDDDDWRQKVGTDPKKCAKWLIEQLEGQGIILD